MDHSVQSEKKENTDKNALYSSFLYRIDNKKKLATYFWVFLVGFEGIKLILNIAFSLRFTSNENS